MKRNTTLLITALIICITATTWPAVPKLISYQGLLKNNLGVPVPNASYSVTFTIYNAPAGGINLWTETQSVTTSSGLFTVLLGSGPIPLADSIFNDTTRYLGIKIGADPEMTPRDRLTTVPYSYRTSTVDGASGGTITGNTSIQNDLTVSGNVGIGTFPASDYELRAVNSGNEGFPLIGSSGEAINSSTGDATGIVGVGTSSSGKAYGGHFAGSSAIFGNSYGVYGEGDFAGVYGTGISLGYGVWGSSLSGDGIYAYGGRYGVNATGGSRGVDAGGGAYGVYSTSSSGIGVYGSSSTSTGVYGNSSSGYAVYAVGGPDGVVGIASYNGGSGIYGSNGGNPSTYAGYFVGTLYTSGNFIAGGTKSAAVKTDNGQYHLMYAQESPENWFEDFGTAKLVNGQATINIDPLYTQTVNTAVNYHVFLTPEGDCQGLYVSSKLPSSFEIRELQNGKSSVAVSYRIVAKRNGYENVRLAKLEGPTPEEVQAKMTNEQARFEAERKQMEEQQVKMEAEHKLQEEQRAKIQPEHQ